MRILHYFLGFPPYRTGGLTRYAFDLMEAQVNDGNNVIALWPGEIKSYNCAPSVKKRKLISGIENYELINPLPVPLDEGISNLDVFTKKCDPQMYLDFLQKVMPDVIHIHTLMGLHKEFIEVANQLEIRTIYTSHDYFGLCPKVTLYKFGECCDDDHCCKDCIQCNVKSLSLRKIQIMQSPLYRWLKDTSIIKALRKRHRGDFFAEEVMPDMPNVDVSETAASYRKLRAYYVWMYEHMDFLHFNSTVAEKVFKKYLTPKDSKVVSITHKGITDNRKNYHVESEKLRIVYLAPAKPLKGFNVLKQALDTLWVDGERNFELKVFSPVANPSPYMVIKEDGFAQSELKDIFSNSDVLVAPSVWYETFGFTVLEALSYGVPVIVSDHVGAKDIVDNGGMLFKSNDYVQLKDVVSSFKKHSLIIPVVKEWRQLIKEMYRIYI